MFSALQEAPDTRPVVTLERNNAGHLFIGVTEFDEQGMGVRAFVLSSQHFEPVNGEPYPADVCMERRYADMVRLMGDNIRTEMP